jgi:iron-sulfur cluster repair protein YtfE (RIC family)
MEATATELDRESRLLEALRDDLERYVRGTKPELAEHALEVLDARMRVRLRHEEDVVFPRIEASVSDPHFLPTARLRRQHQVLFDLLESVGRAVRERDWVLAGYDLRELGAALRAHLDEERRVLLPMLR